MLAVIAVGNSMIPDGIREGYVVMCDCGREPARDDAVFVEKLNGSAPSSAMWIGMKNGSIFKVG